MVVSFTCPLTPNAYYPLSLLRGSVKVLVAQSCLTLCDPVDYSPPSSYVHGILQARMLEWVPFPFSRHLPSPGTEPEPSVLQADIYLLSHQRRLRGNPIFWKWPGERGYGWPRWEPWIAPDWSETSLVWSPCMWVCQGCYDTVPQTECLKQKKSIILIFLEARSPKSRDEQVRAPLKVLVKVCLVSPPGHASACGCITLVFYSLLLPACFFADFPFSKNTSHAGIGAHSTAGWPHLG